MSSSVTLAEVLQAKGCPLEEEEIWALMVLGTEHLLEGLRKESSSYIICPWSVLLSAEGSLSFKDHLPQADIAPFRAPEILCEQNKSNCGLTKTLMYSLGMTLYWSADYQLSPNQPVQLSDHLHTILLSLCEDLPHKRLSPESVLEACEAHQMQSSQCSANNVTKRLVKFVLGRIRQTELGATEDNIYAQLNRSNEIRKRLHEKGVEGSALPSQLNLHQESKSMNFSHSTEGYRQLSKDCAESSSVSENMSSILPNRESRQGRAPQAQKSWDSNYSGSRTHSSYKLFINRSASTVDEIANGIQRNSSHKVLCLGSSSTFSGPPKDSLSAPVFSTSLFQRKEKFSGPEFIILSNEPPVTLQLPGSIVTKKGKSYFSQRDVNVILLNGQCLEVKCNIKSKAQDVFNTVVAYANLVEHFYFGLAYMKGKEFFFLEDDTKLYKVAPEGWTDQHKKKTSIINFTIFLRIRYFVDDFNVIQHGLTRHQFYLQLRKDLLEERMYCNDKTILQLGALALQAELGNYAPEVHGKTYFRVEDYIPAYQIEKLTLEHIQCELAKLHRRTHSLFEEEAELEFLKVTQKLPEYGVFFHHVFQEKKTVGGDVILGICAKGIIVYEVKNHTRIANVQFQWRETERISAHRKKFMIESSFSGKKHTFLTDTVKTCKYLLDLCSAQHRFNAQINSWQLLQDPSGDSRFMEIVRSHSAYISPRDELTLIQRLSHSENVLYGTNLESMSAEIISKSCDNLSMETSNENGEKSNLARTPSRLFQSETHINLNDKQRSYDYLSIHSTQTTASAPGSPCNQRKSSLTRVEREIICVILKRDPKSGFGFVIIGGETVGKLDLGIFIASIIPGGPADRAGHIKPGGRLISVNNISLEGVSFNTAVQFIQNSPDEVELIISQPKDGFEEGLNEERHLPRKISITSGSETSCILSERQIAEDCHTAPTEEDGSVDNESKKIILQNIAPKLVPKFPVCSMDTLVPQESYPLTPTESQEDDIYSVELTKENDSFGISVTGGISTNVLYGGIYVKSIIPSGPADKDGQIKKGDRLLEVDGINLCGVTHRQAVESLKRSKQVARLVLSRAYHIPAELHPGDDTSKDEHMSLSLTVPNLSENPKTPSFISDDNTFEVTLRKNSGGLGFSFLQMEGDICERFGRDIVRIKRLFPGQPAEESGEIAVGDIILAVNGKSVQGLLYQEVLHLLRGAPPIVTLRLYRLPRGTLPEIDQTSLSPLPSPTKEFVPSLEPSYDLDNTVSDEEGSSPEPNSPTAAHDGELIEEEHSLHEEQEIGNNSTNPLRDSLGECSYKHRWKIRQEAITSETFLSLEEEVRQGCYSPCELERAQRNDDLEFEKSGDDLVTKYYQPEVCSPTPVDEEYLTISSTSFIPLSHDGKSEVGIILEPEELDPTSISLSGKQLCTSDDEWEDLEEAERDMKEQQDVRETRLSMTLTRSLNKNYGFTVVVNKMDNFLYVAEIFGEPALSDGRLRIGDRLLMVNGKDAATLSTKETLAILRSSTCELHLEIGRTTMESSTYPSLDEIPEIILKKDDRGQLGLKLTAIGSKKQGIYVLDIVPGSPASQEGSLQPLDKVVCICGLWTEGMSLDDAVRECDAASQIVRVRATRNGAPVIPLELQNKQNGDQEEPASENVIRDAAAYRALPEEDMVDMQAPPTNETVNFQEQHLSSKNTKFPREDSFTPEHRASNAAVHEDCIINIELEKAANGSLGFALVGGRNGRAILIKAISPGSVADTDGRLRVGDILLKVNGHFVSGLTRNTVIDILRKAHSTVQLTVCRSAALRWAYLDSQWDESPFQCGSDQLDKHGDLGVIGAQEDFTLQSQEESNQMYSKDSAAKSNSPIHDQGPESSSAGQQTTQMGGLAEAAPSLTEEEDIVRKLSGWPRGATLISDEELSQLSLFKPSKTKYGLRLGIKEVIQKFEWKIEQQQEIIKEFVSLEHLKPLDDCLIGKAAVNRDKNRYRDILPYDRTRVPLGPSKAYINASYIHIRLDKEELYYISTQGPLPITINDFWQMVWENQSNVIAMITKEAERGIVKCHRYWPEPPHDYMDLSQFQLRLDNYQILDCFIIRMIELIEKQTKVKRIVHHLQFISWPDHGTPKSADHLVKYVRYMRKIHRTGPIITHCSAGIGRSGVLLCVDILLNHIERDMIFDIKQIVKDLRQQRFGMIQTKVQYMFCYEIALEVLKNIQNMERP